MNKKPAPIIDMNAKPFSDAVTVDVSLYPPHAGWQLCPKCAGSGYVFTPISDGTTHKCDLCNGKKIISIQTGQPPL